MTTVQTICATFTSKSFLYHTNDERQIHRKYIARIYMLLYHKNVNMCSQYIDEGK